MLKKKLKGFTLVEMIIALGVFMVMGLVLAMIVSMTSTLIMESQYTSEKAATHNYHSSVILNAGSAGAEDTVLTSQTISINGVDLTGVNVVELEGSSAYADSPTGSQYESAPNIKVIVGT